MEAWGDGAAAFNDGESPYCLAHRLCRASFAGFGSGRALLAGGVTIRWLARQTQARTRAVAAGALLRKSKVNKYARGVGSVI